METGAGVAVTAGRSTLFGYDRADWLTRTTDHGLSSAAVDDQLVESAFGPTGRELERKVSKKDAALGTWALKQKTNWDHFANGKLKTMSTANGSGAVLESHTVGYDDPAGIYVNGNRTRDTFTLVGPDTTAACRTTACTASYTYDAQDRLVAEHNGHGAVTNFTLDAAGNVAEEKITRAGVTATETMAYDGNGLTRTSGVGDPTRYFYDSEGNLDCITRDDGSAADCNPTTGSTVSPKLVADHHYDYLNRLDGADRLDP